MTFADALQILGAIALVAAVALWVPLLGLGVFGVACIGLGYLKERQPAPKADD